jgi:isopentenyl-diphosphate delta-isomerase
MREEQLILVNEGNRAIGSAGKDAVHRRGLLHRAFSIFLVDSEGRMLLQQRNRRKYHSGGLWSNSCCGHPRPGELTISAARRRMREELGIEVPLQFAFHARYRAGLDHGLEENEYVYVYFGALARSPKPDPEEISDLDLASVGEITRRIRGKPGMFTEWLRHYFNDHLAEIALQVKKTATGGRMG